MKNCAFCHKETSGDYQTRKLPHPQSHLDGLFFCNKKCEDSYLNLFPFANMSVSGKYLAFQQKNLHG